MTTIQFSVPYTFQIIGIPKRGKNKRTTVCYEMLQLSVPSIDIAEAPIAATFETPFMDLTYKGEGDITTLRQHDGRLFVKVITDFGKETLNATPEMVSSLLTSGQFSVEHPERLSMVLPVNPDVTHNILFPDDSFAYSHLKAFKEEQWEDFSSNDRDANRAKARQRFADLIVVEGEFWHAVPEPVYLLRYYGQDRNEKAHVSSSIISTQDIQKYGPDQVFGLSDWERMADTALARYQLSLDESRRANIIIEDAFPYDDILEKFMHKVGRAIQHDGDMLNSFRIESMISWAKLRDAYRQAKSSGFSAPALDAVADAADEYSHCTNSSMTARNAIAEALFVYDERTIRAVEIDTNAKPK